MVNIRRFLLLCFCMSSFMASLCKASENRDARQGVVDLMNWKGETNLALAGEWFFFPHEIVEPLEFLRRAADPLFQPRYVRISQSFAEATGESGADQGYGTYVLRIKNWPTREPIGFSGVHAYTAANIYFFGSDGQGAQHPVQRLGRVAKDEQDGEPQIRDEEIQPLMAVELQDYFFLIQVSNYHHAWGGLWTAPEVAYIPILHAEGRLRERILFFVVGCLSFAAAYNFSLFSRRPEDKGSLILGFLAVVLALKTATASFFPAPLFGSFRLAYAVNLKLLYMMMMLVPMLSMMFLRCYFPKFVPKILHHGVVGFLSLASLYFALVPARIFSVLGTASQIFGLTFGLLCSICVLRAWLAKERGASLVVWGCLAVLAGALLDVLATKGLVRLPVNLISVGLVVFIMMQSQIVAVHFAYAFRKAEHLSRELQSEVDRQTRDIKSILDSIQQGIFTLVGTGWTVGDQFSAYLKKIVKKDEVAGSALDDLLLKNSSLSSDAKAQTMSALNAAMSEDAVIFDTNAHCLVPEIIFTPDGTDQSRTLELEWTPMVDSQNNVDKILVCVRDVTEIRALKQKAQQHEEELSILQEILRIPEDRFQRFIQKTEEYLRQNRQLILNVDSYKKSDVIRHLFMNMHTIKGTARTYFLYAISAASHDVEQFYAALQKEEVLWEQERLLNDLDRVGSLVRHYDQIGREKLGWSSTEKLLRLPRRRLLDGLDRLNFLHTEALSEEGWGVLTEVESILMESCYSPIHAILEDGCKGIDSLARDLDKLVPNIQMTPSTVIMRDDGADILHSILIHLVRNSLDHGLEFPEQREAAGKPAQGTIAIEIEEHGSNLILFFGDDGQGLDLVKIEELGRVLGLLQPNQTYPAEAVADLIFQTGFSTKGEVTEVSGRGVGMDAVRNYLKNVGGEISIQFLESNWTQRGRSFRFEIILPGELWWSPARRKAPKPTVPLKRLS